MATPHSVHVEPAAIQASIVVEGIALFDGSVHHEHSCRAQNIVMVAEVQNFFGGGARTGVAGWRNGTPRFLEHDQHSHSPGGTSSLPAVQGQGSSHLIAGKYGPNVLLCMPNWTKYILLGYNRRMVASRTTFQRDLCSVDSFSKRVLISSPCQKKIRAGQGPQQHG
jgi:hypothetical protein